MLVILKPLDYFARLFAKITPNSMKIKLLLIPFLLFPLIAHLQHIEVSTTNPLWGESVEISYRPDSTSALQLSDDVYVYYTAYNEDYSKEMDLLKMENKGRYFKVTLTIGQNTAAYSFQFRNAKDYDRSSTLVLKPISNTGTFYRNAYLPDLMQSGDAYQKELELYPANFSVYRTRWQLLGFTQKDSAKIIVKEEMNEIIASKNINESYYFALSAGHAILGQFDEAKAKLEQLMERFPQSPLIQETFSWYQYQSFSQSVRDTLISDLVRQFIVKYPASSLAKNNSHLLVKKDVVLDTIGLRKLASHWVKADPSNAGMYYYLALVTADRIEKTTYLQQATTMLIDPIIGMKHYYSWDFNIPYELSKIAKVYASINANQEAMKVFKLIEDNTNKRDEAFYLQKGKLLEALDQAKEAMTTFLLAADAGSEEGKKEAQRIYDDLVGDDKFEDSANKLLKQLFYAEKVMQAPSFSVTALNGETYDSESLKGKVVVLNFWFIGCAPCRIEIPGLNEMIKEYAEKEVVFIAFALDDAKALETFLSELPFDYAIIPGAHEVSSFYGVQAFPTHVIIDKMGNIRSTLTGGSAERHEQIKPLIDRLLKY